MAQAPAIPLNFQRFAIVIGKFCGPTERRTLAQPDSWVHAHLDEYCGTIRKWLSELANGLGLCEADGAALHYTPHDFRRLFITDIVNAGFPIHLAAKIVGHNNIEVTRACTAVYQKDVFDAYERFINNRRLARPSAAYHERTQTEWDEFIQHFGQRKIAPGSCHRPYGSDCAHEHACIRCDFCQIDPSQSGRLDEIRDNLRLQAEEAQRNRWLGDVGTATAHHPACGSEG
jgi:Phage integrase family